MLWKEISTETFYSIGGGFIIQENDNLEEVIEINKKNFPFPINRAKQLEEYCEKENLLISEIVFKNELELKVDALKQQWDEFKTQMKWTHSKQNQFKTHLIQLYYI